ncbi:unnamed protein product [Parascedosporium putredinis]|uniref:Uncharacterized protein n=1 Tax=Parascedosporium putredinis TaxID=1442378 RepID=A0A9P1H501_9PEZI|nr:unnamed protein product [Parascedosporium putredinis]CAI7996419.1 unnamed protein product [Parascedosporium putredinis]
MPPATQPEATRSDCLVPVSSLTLDAVQETQLSQLETTISATHKQPIPTNVEISDSQSSHNSLPDPINYRYLIEPKDEICVADVLTNDDPTSREVRPSPILGGRCPASSDPVSELFPGTAEKTEKTSFSTVVPSQEYDSSIHLSHSQTSQLPTPGPESVVSDAPSPPRARRDPYDLDFSRPLEEAGEQDPPGGEQPVQGREPRFFVAAPRAKDAPDH